METRIMKVSYICGSFIFVTITLSGVSITMSDDFSPLIPITIYMAMYKYDNFYDVLL